MSSFGTAAFQKLHQTALSEPTSSLLLTKLELYEQTTQSLGISTPKLSLAGLSALTTMSTAKKNAIIEYLELWTSWVNQCPRKSDIFEDTALLDKALSHYGLEMDDQMRSTIDLDTVIEVYSEEMIQIYRSFKMLSMTSYSLLDLCAYEWFVLWERPHLVVEQMYSDVQEIFRSELPCRRMSVSPHIVKENFNTGLTEPFYPRSSIVQFQHIGFLKRLRSDSPRAFICTAKGSIVSENPVELEQLAFL